MKTFLLCIILAVVNIGIAYLHAIYLGDYIAQITGYVVDLYVVPALFGLITGTVAVGLLEHNVLVGLREHWWILLMSGFFALLPSLYYVVFMTFFMEGS
jgi:hypothetical protein